MQSRNQDDEAYFSGTFYQIVVGCWNDTSVFNTDSYLTTSGS